MSQNPLLVQGKLPPMEAVEPNHVLPAVQQILQQNREAIEALEKLTNISWETLVQPMEVLGERLHDCWAVVSHLHGVQNSEALRTAYDEALPLITAYSTELGQNRALYEAWLALRESEEFDALNQAQQTAVEHALRDFRLSGVALPPDDQQRFAGLQQRLAELATTFSNNVLDATRHWYLQLDAATRLDGVPDAVLQSLRQQAEARGLEGYVLTLDIPCYLPVMQHAGDRALRQQLYLAYNTRASDQGPDAGRWDNSVIMTEILAARHEMARLLGFADYAELSLATKMAADPRLVVEFLEDLASKSRPVALREFEELQQFALERDGLAELAAWDVPYYSEQLRQSRYAVSEQELRPYFPAPGVIAGMFEVAGRLFGVSFEPDESIQSYHPDVSFYRVLRDGQVIAGFYLDPYVRDEKRGGAWMADARNRYRHGQRGLQLPIAFLSCNFSRPGEDTPSLLTHTEVTTLFHEFGHGLHHMLSQVEVASVSGINGVAWDAVELPSQFLENWCWQKESLDLISGHYRTAEPLPDALLDKMLAARNFQAGMAMVRQLELASFDFRLHLEYRPEQPRPIQQVLDEVREQLSVVPVPASNRFQHGFGHIFAGGYAAGYYSYKWAEVLSADAFSRFEREGVFNAETGGDFRRQVLETGGSVEASAAFRAFRGREPDSEALLRHNGIVA